MATDSPDAPAADAIEARVLAFVHDDLLGPGMWVKRDTELLSGEVLDSMSVLRLATFVSESFDIGIQPSDFVVEHFRSVAAIAEFVRRTLLARSEMSSER